MLIDNFEQHFLNCVLKVENAMKIAHNQINNLNTLKNELVKIFCGYRVFEYALWQKMKTWKGRKSTESFLNQKSTHINCLPLLKSC